MADDIGLQKNGGCHVAEPSWIEGYKAGAAALPLTGYPSVPYMIGYMNGGKHRAQLMESNMANMADTTSLYDQQAKRPSEFDKWEAYVLGPDCLARCILKREDMYALLCYVRRLERDVEELGSFW